MKLKAILTFFIAIFYLNEGAAQDLLPVCDDAVAPTISTEKQISCSGQAVILKATGCNGTIVWSNQKTGISLTDFPTKTTTYTAYCKQETCKSNNSNALTVEVNVPQVPIINSSQKIICLGQSATLTAVGCPAEDLLWSNGMKGSEITVSPKLTTRYTATCRVNNCYSCFANEVEVKVRGNEVLQLSASKAIVCPGENVILSVVGQADGKILWSNGASGKDISINPVSTTTYSAKVEYEDGCTSINSTDISVQVGNPLAPRIASSKTTICFAETAVLTAESCDGVVTWSDGRSGNSITIKNEQLSEDKTLSYTATCKRGTCQSVVSEPIVLNLIRKIKTPNVETELVNKCPFVSIDLSSAIKSSLSYQGSKFVFHTAERSDAPIVEVPGAVTTSGVYYLEETTSVGCNSIITPIIVKITDCKNPLPTCLNNPATASIIKTERTLSGNYLLQGKIGGSAIAGVWTTNGTGSFSNINGLSTVYNPSDEDRSAGKITINFKTEDPDGTGPCLAASSTLELKIETIPNNQREALGLSKYLNAQTALGDRKYELEYNFVLANMGTNDLVEVQLIDSLDKTFKSGMIVGKPKITIFDSKGQPANWEIDDTYTGQNGHYEMLLPEKCELPKGEQFLVNLKFTIDASTTTDTLFSNSAFATSIDINNKNCSDISTDGKDPDPDKNGDPSDNSKPTILKLPANGTAYVLNNSGPDEDVFIPEGFSPNGDGINDNFIIRQKGTQKVSVEIYNRWGGVVYRSEDYKNDWNGVSNQKVASKDKLPEGSYFYSIKLSDGREYSKFLTISR